MKKLMLFFGICLAIAGAAFAQEFPSLDKSPMDMAWFPDNFAHDRKTGEQAIVRIIYSRPARNGREIFGKLVPYGKIWRVGANEATEIKFYKDVQIGGELLQAGTYSLFAIPGENEWTIVFNSDLDFWGAYSYKKENDVLRATAIVSKLDKNVEHFSIRLDENGSNLALLKMGWDNTLVTLPIQF